MPKIKLKPNRESVEIAAGNVLKLRIERGETVEVAPEFIDALLSLGHFEPAGEADGEAENDNANDRANESETADDETSESDPAN